MSYQCCTARIDEKPAEVASKVMGRFL